MALHQEKHPGTFWLAEAERAEAKAAAVPLVLPSEHTVALFLFRQALGLIDKTLSFLSNSIRQSAFPSFHHLSLSFPTISLQQSRADGTEQGIFLPAGAANTPAVESPR